MEDTSATAATGAMAANAVFLAHSPNGKRKNIKISIALPEQDPQSDMGDMRCRIEVSSLLTPYYAYGIDSLQALGLAFASLRRNMQRFSDEGWEFYHPQDPSTPITFPFLYCGDESACPWSTTPTVF